MTSISFSSFSDELEKISSAGHAAVDLLGLGMLAAPSVQGLRGKEMSEKSKHKTELAGLGTLAAGVAHENRPHFAAAGRTAMKYIGGVLKKASADEYLESLAEDYLKAGKKALSDAGHTVMGRQ